MHLRTLTIRYCLLALLLLALLPFGYGQKVREKKDIISVDNVQLYKFIRTKGGIGKPVQEHVIMTMTNDTLVWYRSAVISLRKAEHEKYPPKDDYWELRFAGVDSVIAYKPNGSLYYELIELGVLKDGKLDLLALPAFQKAAAPKLLYIRLLQSADAHRQKLEAMPRYAEYSKKLIKRSADDNLTIDNGKIFYQNTVGAPPEHIGYFEQKQPNKGIMYNVYRNSDRFQVATVLHELTSEKATIKTYFDNASYEYEIPFSYDYINQAILYLVWNGYL